MCYKPSLLKNPCTHTGLCAISRAQSDISNMFCCNNVPKFNRLKKSSSLRMVFIATWLQVGWVILLMLAKLGWAGLRVLDKAYLHIGQSVRLLPDVGWPWLGWLAQLYIFHPSIGRFLGHCRGLSEEEKVHKHLVISAHIKSVYFSFSIHVTRVNQFERTLPNGRVAERQPGNTTRLLGGILV